MSDFKVGDEVMLKSGGPRMTVVSLFGKEVKCEWAGADGFVNREFFSVVCLEKLSSVVTIKITMEGGYKCDLFPTKAHKDDAAYDLRSSQDIDLPVGKSTLIHTGIFMQLPVGYEAQIRPRSGLALKNNITLTNSPGTIDAGYRDEVGVIAYNAGSEVFVVKRGDRIAQMVINKLPEVELVFADELGDSQRGEGGFGSTGK